MLVLPIHNGGARFPSRYRFRAFGEGGASSQEEAEPIVALDEKGIRL